MNSGTETMRSKTSRCFPLVTEHWSKAAARIAAPSTILPATVTEWLATGTGLGNLMAVDAATSRYTSLWSTVVVVTVVSLLAYALIEFVEHRVLRVVAPEQTRW